MGFREKRAVNSSPATLGEIRIEVVIRFKLAKRNMINVRTQVITKEVFSSSYCLATFADEGMKQVGEGALI